MGRNTSGRVNQSHFANVPQTNKPRSVFPRSSSYRSAFDSGYLYPVYFDEILPGDTLNLRSNFLVRLATPLYPYMDVVDCDVHFWFIPNRVVWENWERFCGAQDSPNDSTDFLVPQLDRTSIPGGFVEDTLYDYFGLPTQVAFDTQAEMPNSLLFRAYNKVWQDWYRDENYQDESFNSSMMGDGPDDADLYYLRFRNRRKDYFTSVLPEPQKGPDVLLDLGTRAPISGIGFATTDIPSETNVVRKDAATTGVGTTYANAFSPASNFSFRAAYNAGTPTLSIPDIYADLTKTIGAPSVEAFREAFTLQQFFELDARGGTRYIEYLYNHFGVVSPDFRLQRPEFLGQVSFPINVNPIAQTSEKGTIPQGNLAAFAVGRGQGSFNHSFVEHGHVLGLASIRAQNAYQEGYDKMWRRRSLVDFYDPIFANLGEQAVLNEELVFTGDPTVDQAVFGYQERFGEYRYKNSLVTGAFRSNHPQSLDAWHLALDFGGMTPGAAALMPEQPPIDRIIAVPSARQFEFDAFYYAKHVRTMPTYSIPGLHRL